MPDTHVLTEAATSKFVDANGVRVHYNEAGSGAPVILIHGGGPGAGGWSNYNRNMEPLSKHFRVICPDLPGFGKSDMKPLGSAMPGWYAEKMADFMRAIGLKKAHFIGNSLGGMVTLKLALEHPEMVDKMVLMGTGGSLPVFSTFPTEGIKTLLFFYDGPGPSLQRLKGFINQFVYDPSQITDELLEQRMKVALDPRIVANPPMRPNPNVPLDELWRDARLTKLPHETLMIWGREDRVMPIDMAFPLLKQIPRARLFVIPQCGHWAQWEHADEFNRTVSGFFSA